MKTARWFSFIVFIGSIAFQATTHAQTADPKVTAKRHFDIGAQLFAAEDFDGAALEFEASVKAFATKSGYFNLAGTYKALHRYADALAAIEQLETRFAEDLDETMRRKTGDLKTAILGIIGEIAIVLQPEHATVSVNEKPVPPERLSAPLKLGPGVYRIAAALDGYEPAVQSVTLRSGQELEVRIALVPKSGRLVIRANQEGASVSLNKTPVGRTPLENALTLKPGTYEIDITLPGYVPVTRTVRLGAGSEVALDLQMAEVPPTPAAPLSGPNEAPKAVDSAPPAHLPVMSKNRRSPFRPLKAASLAGAIVTAVGAGVFYGLAAKYASDFDSYNDNYATAPNDEYADTYDAKRHDAYDKNGRFSNLGLSFGIVSGGLVASTIVFAVFEKRSAKKENGLAVSLLRGKFEMSF